MDNVILRFAKQLTKYDPLLQERVEGLYHKIFEGVGTNAALDNLRNRVGNNTFETEGDNIFGLSGAAGFDDAATPEQSLDSAIDDGVEMGNIDDFGTAISGEMAPTEDDFGLGDEPSDDLGGLGDDGLFDGEDTGMSSDLGLDGLDDEADENSEDNTENTDDLGGESGDGMDDMPDGDFDLGDI